MLTADLSPRVGLIHAARMRLLPALLLLLLAALPLAARADEVVVNSNGDNVDGDLSSIAALIAAPGPDGLISLREAILAANNTPGTDLVTFTFGVDNRLTIQLTGTLPEVTDPIWINGTCGGVPCVRLLGAGTASFDGLVIVGGLSIIEGLVLNHLDNALVLRSGGGNLVRRCYVGVGFDGATEARNRFGIRIESANNTVGTGAPGHANVTSGNLSASILITGAGATGNQIKGNFIGTDRAGAQKVTGSNVGVRIEGGASNNTIGGTVDGARNVISGNNQIGVEILGSETKSNQVAGNFIGLDATGTAQVFNNVGVQIRSGASFNFVGGANAGARNVISGNLSDGIRIEGEGTDFNDVLGNFIGTRSDGLGEMPNEGDGVEILAGPHGTDIGGVSDGAGNVISGNMLDGVSIEGSDVEVIGNIIGLANGGTAPLPNRRNGVFISGANNVIGGMSVGRRNVISGNGENGVYITGAVDGGSGQQNRVMGNYIGTDRFGEATRPNQLHGVRIEGAKDNIVGGVGGDAGNVISGNGQDGIRIERSAGGVPATGNRVLGNLIGTNAAGTVELRNQMHGVFLRGITSPTGVSGNVIGGSTPPARNVISGNRLDGVRIEMGSENAVSNNYIGIDLFSESVLPNGRAGVVVTSSQGNTIGGDGTGNTIGGNEEIGVRIDGGSENRVTGNFIGTNRDGADLSNNGDGIRIGGSSQNRIGEPGEGNANTIGFTNGDAAIRITGGGASNNKVQNNFIGVDRRGRGMQNGGLGVFIEGGGAGTLTGNVIGGVNEGEGNSIAHSVSSGIAVVGANALSNTFHGNRIYSNGFLGIDLGDDNVTDNDPGDGDAGPNRLQNYPELTSATPSSSGGFVTIEGTLNSTPNTTFRVEFFSSAVADPSGHGEGQRYLGAHDVTTDALGMAAFSEPEDAVTVGHVITATATDPDGNTSEFSAAVEVVDDTPSVTVTFDDELGDGDATNPTNWDTDDLPTADDTAVFPAASTARIPAGGSLQVRQLDVFGAVGSPTTFTLLGTLTAEVVRQFAFTTVTMDGGTAVVETATNTGGTTRLSNGGTVTSQQGTGSYAVTSGGRIEVDGAGNTMDVNVATTNATISVTPGSELGLQRESILNTITRIFNENPSAGEATVNLHGASTVAGNTDLCDGVALKNMGDLTLKANVRDCNDDGGWIGNFLGTTVMGSVSLGVNLMHMGHLDVPAGRSLTQTAGGVYKEGSSVGLNGMLTFLRPAGSSAEYEVWGSIFTGSGILDVRAPTHAANPSFSEFITVQPNGSDGWILRSGADPLMLPTVAAVNTGGGIDCSNPSPDPNVPDCVLKKLTDGSDPNVSTLDLENGTFDVWAADLPPTSSFQHANLIDAIFRLSGPAVFDDFFEVRKSFDDGISMVHISTEGHLELESEASLTLRAPVVVERVGSQYGTINLGPNAALGLRADGNFQGGDGQLQINDGGWVAIGAEVGNTSTVNFSTVPKGSGEVWVNPNGEVRFSAERCDAPVYLNGGTILPSNGVVYTGPFRYASGQNLAPAIYLGGLITDGQNPFLINLSSTVGEGGNAVFNTDLRFDPAASLTFGFGSTGVINGFHDLSFSGPLREDAPAVRPGGEVETVRPSPPVHRPSERGAGNTSVIANEIPAQRQPRASLLPVPPRAAQRGGLGFSVAAKGGDAALVLEVGGLFSKAGGGETDVFVPVLNEGMFLAEEGTVVVHDVFDSPGLLGGAGTFDVEEGVVSVGGPVGPGMVIPASNEERVGALTWIGAYAPLTASELFIDVLDDGGPGVGHDLLHVEGDVALTGSLRVTPLGPAPPGDYPIVTFTGTLTGSFDGLDLPAGASVLYPGDPEGTPGAVILRTTLVLPPVELAAFDALLSGSDVELAWRTESETNNAGFEVQRRTEDEETWRVIGYVEGHGTTTEAHAYRFTDADLPFEAATAHYRLKQVDFDGAFEYGPEVEVALALPAQFALHANYPNPFNPATTIRYEVPTDGHVRLVVYDVLGRTVAILVDGPAQAGRHEVRFDASGLASGFYVYRLESDAFTQARRMMLVK